VQNHHITRRKLLLTGQTGVVVPIVPIGPVRLFGLICLISSIGLAAGLTGCASAPYHGDDGQVWPPAQMRPVRIAVAPPIEPLSISPLYESLAGHGSRAAHETITAQAALTAEHRSLTRCAWQQGAALLAQQAIPGTEISTHLFGRWALGPSDRWVSCTTDSLGGWTCTLTDQQVVDFARRNDISHLVVPRRLTCFTPDPADSSVILLAADVAVIDPLEQRVVWSGPVTADPQDLRAFDGLTPSLTVFEQATYTWLVALFRVFDRIEVWPEEDLGTLARCCQELPPVFDWPEDPPADVSQIIE